MLSKYFEDPYRIIDYSHTTTKYPNADFHLHNHFEIYFFIAGNVHYFVEKKVYPLRYGDLLVINSHEIHKPSIQSPEIYERITIHFNPQIIQLFDSPNFDLLNCFINRPIGEQNKINLNLNQQEEVFKLLQRFEHLNKNNTQGSEILNLTYFMELLVYINRVFLSIPSSEEQPNVPGNLLAILDYIDNNLVNDLSLEFLEKHFYINRFYLSRLFKKTTGSNLRDYIIYKRISLAKKLLVKGHNVSDVCQMSGFNDYANFIRTFKQTVGMSPGHYGKSHKIR